MESYDRGITPTDLAKVIDMEVAQVTSQGKRLADMGLITRTRRGKPSIYKVADRDLMLVHIQRSQCYEEYHNQHKKDENPVSDYITAQSFKSEFVVGMR